MSVGPPASSGLCSRHSAHASSARTSLASRNALNDHSGPQFSRGPAKKVTIKLPTTAVRKDILTACRSVTTTYSDSDRCQLTIRGVSFDVVHGAHSNPSATQDCFDAFKALKTAKVPAKNTLFLIEGQGGFNGVLDAQPVSKKASSLPCKKYVYATLECEFRAVCETAKKNGITVDYFMPDITSASLKAAFLKSHSLEDYYFYFIFQSLFMGKHPQNLPKGREAIRNAIQSTLAIQLYIEKSGPITSETLQSRFPEISRIVYEKRTQTLVDKIMNRLDKHIDIQQGSYRDALLSNHAIPDSTPFIKWQAALERGTPEDALFLLKDLGPKLFEGDIVSQFTTPPNSPSLFVRLHIDQTIRDQIAFRAEVDTYFKTATIFREDQAKTDILSTLKRYPHVTHVVAITGRNHLDVFESLAEDPSVSQKDSASL